MFPSCHISLPAHKSLPAYPGSGLMLPQSVGSDLHLQNACFRFEVAPSSPGSFARSFLSAKSFLAFPKSGATNVSDGKLRFEPSKVDFSVSALSKTDPQGITEQLRTGDRSGKCRGRPSAQYLKTLNPQDVHSQRYTCAQCKRSFPRKKSLDTHLLTHTNVKPYQCDFPGCARSFKQSGQLKTHLRLHTGEKPFRCVFPQCTSAFTHANRRCHRHPDLPLRRRVDPLSTSSSAYVSVTLQRRGAQDVVGVETKHDSNKQVFERDSLFRDEHGKESYEPLTRQGLADSVPKVQRVPFANLDLNMSKPQTDPVFKGFYRGFNADCFHSIERHLYKANGKSERSSQERNLFNVNTEVHQRMRRVEAPLAVYSPELTEEGSRVEESKRLLTALALVELQFNKSIHQA